MNHFLDHKIYHFCIHLHTTHNHYKDLFFIGHFRLLYYWFELQCVGILLGGLSDCEELVGLLMEKLVFKNFKKVFLF